MNRKNVGVKRSRSSAVLEISSSTQRNEHDHDRDHDHDLSYIHQSSLLDGKLVDVEVSFANPNVDLSEEAPLPVLQTVSLGNGRAVHVIAHQPIRNWKAREEECGILVVALDEYPTFNLEKAVCNHGFFMMAPNNWDPLTKSLCRPLRLADSSTSVTVTISQPPAPNHHLEIKLHTLFSNPMDKQVILAQVRRMLRLSSKDEKDVQEFQTLHPQAQLKGFGRIFRSPSLFEDAVKCILLCCCTIQDSLNMARLLCEMQSTDGIGNFPNAKELACLDKSILMKHYKLGFRAEYILTFAKGVHTGKIMLPTFENCSSSTLLSQSLRKLKGFGPFVSTNVLMCLGFYTKVPVDTETIRHLKEIQKRELSRNNNINTIIKDVYGKYAPFQCLAFWYELAAYYEEQFGNLSDIPKSMYGLISGSPKKKHHCSSAGPIAP